MNPYALTIMTLSLAMATTTVLTSYHWMLVWIGLEMNTLAIIPLMTKTHHPRGIEAATKYFLTQAAASALMLFSSTMNAWMTGEWTILHMLETPTILLTTAIAIKLGIAPFHLWLPEVLQGLSIKTGLILSTWQKLAPMAVLIQISLHANLYLTLLLGLYSTILGGWGGINQTQTRKIMAYSSVAHLGWMIAILNLSPQLSLMNFYLYILMTMTLFLTILTLNTKNMPDLAISWSKSPPLMALSMLTLLSLSGLPPLTGFLPKWLITVEMIKQNLTALILIMLLSTLLSLFFYLRLTYILSMTLAPNISFSLLLWAKNKKNTLSPMIIPSLILLPVTPLMTPTT
uniref:NADH-ubiquinone oxidoreductase chain 2 n=1 Tax=Pristimantis ridens TaxID=228422 RepID=B3FVQ9_9NEOB|nr:NADH dehydrogenase subunit II [Pristimantis ridens]ACD80011.1 NADH dehydrogenase subunit II [Pristimantis ridens]ACD80014.1 NADH dehydrogenase subunit II [Pristimantis ridens]ACD80024.1 NADH dehydrogenase subunit II [Pristimantis ridens]ACD80026.1 NADH dehydrogenase subunit II [Pristimantis ridens]